MSLRNFLFDAAAVCSLAGLAWTVTRDTGKLPAVPPPPAVERVLLCCTTRACPACDRQKKTLADPGLAPALAGWSVRYAGDRATHRQYAVSEFPTLLALESGTVRGRLVGYADTRQVNNWIAGLHAAGASVGGRAGPDGTELLVDLPGDQHCHNVSSQRQGCCVQTSINHAARWQNVPALVDFQKWVQEKGLPGGAYPGAVDQRIPRCCQDRGYPVAEYIQAEHADYELFKAICKSGRMVCCTYSRSPTGRYGGQRIAHMVNCVHADDKWCVILDNNYPGEDKYEWLTPAEAKSAGCLEWVVALAAPPPPPPPTR